MNVPNTELVDRRNFADLAPIIIGAVSSAPFVGLDCETEDDERHEGLNTYCGYDPVTRMKSKTKALVFDIRRMRMTGFSVYPEGGDTAYYFNLGHADTANNLTWAEVKPVLDALGPNAYFIAHNAAFEITAFGSCHEYDLPRIIDTLQMCVSAWGPDEYSLEDFIAAGQGGFRALVPDIIRHGHLWEQGTEMGPELSDLVQKVIAKESRAAHSYNGFVSEIAYGYGLKKVVQSRFGHKMTTFEEVLRGRAHMGQLTGSEVVAYGAEDAFWVVPLFRHLLTYMARHCPTAIAAFFDQENPMVPVYSSIWRGGMRVNTDAIYERRDLERIEAANTLRDLKAVIRELLPFPKHLSEGLLEHEKWYQKNAEKYRREIEAWSQLPDCEDPFEQLYQARSAVGNAWAIERGVKESKGPNLQHYMPLRVMLYDLLDERPMRAEGKVQSDGEARGRFKTRLQKNGNELGCKLIDLLNKMAGIEQRMKLYLTPYTQLMDPETGRIYPVVSSMLATRRMAAQYPNPMQLAKRGESTYVRGFFEADTDDHVVVSIDWSGIELVEIGEFSGDPEFIKAFGQLPHEDLHSGAAAAILAVEMPELTEDIFKDLKFLQTVDEFRAKYQFDDERLFSNLKGEPLTPAGAYKYWRTEVGKGANFNYWYSGFLSTIGERMGWSMETTGDATERYRERFSVAEEWRLNLINTVARDGYITLPDGQRRNRFEATQQWLTAFLDKFDQDEAKHVWQWIAKKIQKRSFNQSVNAYIQGTCATIAKRSILRINEACREREWDRRMARFMVPIHDELVFSVHKKIVPEFIPLARGIMIDHPDLFTKCKLDASPSIGLTFEPWHDVKAPMGQIELFEMPDIGIGQKGGRIANDNLPEVVDYLFTQKKLVA